jgi:predicted lipoprotein with Yx(FWY)xxD motif
MKLYNLALALLLSATLAACAAYETRPAAPAMASSGVLVGTNGMTLYTLDKDVAGSGKSACNGPCAANWPPLYAMDGDSAKGDFSITIRDDGKKQWSLKGKPLYYWSKDQKPGDKSGDGFNNVWHVAKP